MSLHAASNDRWKSLAPALYAVGTVLFLFPLLDLLLTLLPFERASAEWRFGAAGFGLQTLTSQILALGLLMTVAVMADHRRVARTIGFVCLLIALVAAGVTVSATLDFLQIRRTVPVVAKPRFDYAGIKFLLQGVLGIPVLAGLAIAGFRATRHTVLARDTVRMRAEGKLVVGVR